MTQMASNTFLVENLNGKSCHPEFFRYLTKKSCIVFVDFLKASCKRFSYTSDCFKVWSWNSFIQNKYFLSNKSVSFPGGSPWVLFKRDFLKSSEIISSTGFRNKSCFSKFSQASFPLKQLVFQIIYISKFFDKNPLILLVVITRKIYMIENPWWEKANVIRTVFPAQSYCGKWNILHKIKCVHCGNSWVGIPLWKISLTKN